MNIGHSILTSEGAQTRLTQLLATMREIFWIAPADPVLELMVNSAYERVFGYGLDELKRRRWAWLRSVAKENRRKVLRSIRDARLGKDIEDVEVWILNKDGSRRWLQCRIAVMDDPKLGPGAVMGLALDVTTRKLLQNRLLGVAEEERQRVGMELHDDLCQRLAGLRLKVGVLTGGLNTSESKSAELAKRVAEELSEAVNIARLFAKGLAPVQMDRLGLGQALRDLCETVERTFSIPCTLRMEEALRDPPPEASMYVFRAIQELAVNAAKHSVPEWIEIEVKENRERLLVSVNHNGAVFNPSGKESTGSGLHFLQQRLDALGTSLRRGKRRMADGTEIVTASFEIEMD